MNKNFFVLFSASSLLLKKPFLFCNSIQLLSIAKWEAAQFINHSVKPIRSLKYTQLNFGYLTFSTCTLYCPCYWNWCYTVMSETSLLYCSLEVSDGEWHKGGTRPSDSLGISDNKWLTLSSLKAGEMTYASVRYVPLKLGYTWTHWQGLTLADLTIAAQ